MKELKGRLVMASAALRGRPIIYKVEISYGEVSVKTMPLILGRGARIRSCQVFLPRSGSVLVRKGGMYTAGNEGNAITEVIRK